MLAELDALEIATKAIAGLDPTSMSGSEAAELAARLSSAGTSLEAQRLAALSVVQGSGVWELDGSRSMKAWLVRTDRCSDGRAGSDLKLAGRLATILPRTAQALRDGDISVEHALAISRGACGTDQMVERLADPESGEDFLLSQAGLCVDEFKKFVATWAMRVDPDAADAKQRELRESHTVQLHDTLDGGDLRGFMSPTGSARLRAALDAFMSRPAFGDTRTPGQRRHDALVAMAERVLDGGSVGKHASVRPQLVVNVPFETLIAAAGTLDLAPATLLSGTPIPRTVLDRVACDADVTRIVFAPDGRVLDLGRSERTFNGPLRRALDARDGGCRRPGCSQPPDRCEGHHIVYWRHGGSTSLANGLLLCGVCHGWIHDHGVTITHTGDGGLTFRDRSGRVIGTTYPRSSGL